jgi:S1-C subfamily serine protease
MELSASANPNDGAFSEGETREASADRFRSQCTELLLAEKSPSGNLQLQLSTLAGGLVDGVTEQGVNKIAQDPLGTALSFGGGAALGVALSVAPKWVSIPAAMLAGMSVLKLGEDTIKGVGTTAQALQFVERNPSTARRQIAEAMGAVSVEALSMVAGAGAAYGAGRICKIAGAAGKRERASHEKILPDLKIVNSDDSIYSLKRKNFDDGITGLSPSSVASLSSDYRSAPTPGQKSAQTESPLQKDGALNAGAETPVLHMMAELSYKDASYFFPKLTKESINEFLSHPRSTIKLRKHFVRYTIDTAASDKLTIDGVTGKYLQHELGPDFVKMPVMERQHRRIMLSTRHKDDPLAKLYSDVRESVVKIEAVNERNAGDNWTGSGAFVDEKGTIATALHAVFDATKLSVRTAGGDVHPAKLLAHDLKTDMALLKIDVPGRLFRPLPLAGQKVMDGDKIFVFGHPAGNNNMFVSPGFYHRLEPTQRFVKRNNEPIYASEVYPENAYFAYTRSGNSGGPVLNSRGEIISVHTAAKYHDNWNVSYGASSSELQVLLNQLPYSAKEIKLPFSLQDAVEASLKRHN